MCSAFTFLISFRIIFFMDLQVSSDIESANDWSALSASESEAQKKQRVR